jgi:catecholate siderophore receptor
MYKRGTGWRIRWLLATTFLISGSLGVIEAGAREENKATPSAQVANRYSFNIPAKPLSQALSEIGQIAGISIAASEQQLFGLNSRPVQGDMTARQAVAAALAGTGIRYRFTNAKTVALDLAKMKGFNANAQAADLPTIDVQGGGSKNTVGYIATRTSTATKTDTPLINVPQAVTVVTKQQVQDIGAQRLEDVVRYVPGVVWHQGEGNRDQIVIRGQSSTADFFVNGMRDDAQVFRDLYNAERIEILKGPNAMIFGRGGGGGVLNRVLKDADGVPVNEWRFQTGSYNNKRVSADVGGKVNDQFAARINGVFEDSNSYRDFFHMQRAGVNPTFTWTPTAQTTIKFSYEYFRDYRTADRGIPSQNGVPYDRAAPSTFFGNPALSNTPSTQNIVTALVDHTFDNGLNVKSQTRFADYKRFYQNVYPGSAVNATDMLTLAAYNNSNDRQNIGNQTDWTKKFSLGPTQHTFLFGTEFANQKSANARFSGFFTNTGTGTSSFIPGSNPVSWQNVDFRGTIATPGLFTNTDARNKTNLNIAAAYVQDQVELTRWLQLIGGVRFEQFALGYTNLNNGFNVSGTTLSLPAGTTFSRRDNLVSPRGGIILKPVDNVSFYGSYAVSYLPASGDQFNGLTPGTSAAEPEKFVNKEVGVKWDITPRLTYTTAFYELDRTNSRFPDPNNAGFFILNGATKTRGVEMTLGGYLTDQWQMTGGYAYTDARVVGATSATILAGNRVALVPYNTFSLWNRYDFTEMWGAGLGVIYSSNFYAGSDDAVLLPSYTRVDGAVFWKLNNSLRAQVNVENIFGAKYYPTADGNNNITPGSPRAARFVLTTNFAGGDRPVSNWGGTGATQLDRSGGRM